VTRAGALGLNPNGVALFLAIGVVAALGKLVTTRRPIWLIPLAIMIASFPLAKSRSSLVIVAGGLLGFVIFSRSMRLRIAAIVLTGLVILIIPNVRTRIVDATLQNRAHQLSAESDASRRHAAIKAFHLGMQHPVLGIGWTQFPAAALADPSVGVAINTHDDYARLLAEAGWPALLLFLALLYLAFRGKTEDDLDWALKALLCAMAVSLVTANVLYNIPSAFPYMAVIGTMAGNDYVRRTERIEAREAARAARIGPMVGIDTIASQPKP
jgi:O-antigen ligase